jgi:tetratricopeptide (TPR) repeat protein
MEDAMTRTWFGATLRVGVLAALCVALAAPAYAQLGSLKGRVVDEQGNPVPDAELTFEYAGEMNYRFTGKSDSKGEWIRAGLYSVGGRWTVTAKKGNLAGFVSNIDVPLSAVGEVGDIVIRAGGTVPSAGGMTDAEAEQRNRQQAELKKLFDEVNAALAANAYADALTKLNEAVTKVESCSVCYIRIGDVHSKQGDAAQAETAYKKAIELDPQSAEAYDALAILYNGQKKFAEAGEASAKANELRSASGGGGDATSLYNAGAILVNQGKMAEAQVQFERAIQADPNMGEAHYQLAMTLVNQGKIPEAIKSLEQYLSVSPAGPNAETAKLMLPELKKMQ